MFLTIWMDVSKSRSDSRNNPFNNPRINPIVPPMINPVKARQRLIDICSVNSPDNVNVYPETTTSNGAGNIVFGMSPNVEEICQTTNRIRGNAQGSSLYEYFLKEFAMID